MKRIFFLIGVVTLVATAGCVVVPEHRHGWHHHEHAEYRAYPAYRGYPEPGVDLHIHAGN